MKKISWFTIAVFLTAFVFLSGQEKTQERFSSYEEMRAQIGKLYQQKKYAEAAGILEKALTQFPGHLQANAYNLALMCVLMEEHDRAVDALEYGLEQGIWFGKYAVDNEIWAPLESMESFKAFKRRNEAKRQEAQRSAQPKLEVCVPSDYDKSKTYPLFIALHGGGENIEEFKPQWTSDLLKREYIVAYPQSSQIVSMTGFSWTEDAELSKKEIRKAYEKITQDYPVDPSRVIVGGFSSGGVASLDVVLDDIIPAVGFVVLCPAKPESFSPEKIGEARARGIRGTLLTTEMDPRLPVQKEMAAVMKAEGLAHEFVVTPNIGHWYPENLGRMIDAAIGHILGETSH